MKSEYSLLILPPVQVKYWTHRTKDLPAWHKDHINVWCSFSVTSQSEHRRAH